MRGCLVGRGRQCEKKTEAASGNVSWRYKLTYREEYYQDSCYGTQPSSKGLFVTDGDRAFRFLKEWKKNEDVRWRLIATTQAFGKAGSGEDGDAKPQDRWEEYKNRNPSLHPEAHQSPPLWLETNLRWHHHGTAVGDIVSFSIFVVRYLVFDTYISYFNSVCSNYIFRFRYF